MQTIFFNVPARAKTEEITMVRKKFYTTKKDCIYWYMDSENKKKFAFRYKYYDRFGKRKEKSQQGFDTELAAERALIEVKANVLDGNDRYVENANLTVAQWMEIWFEMKKSVWRPGTYIHYQESYNNHIKPLIGHYKLQKLTKMTLQRELIDVLVSYRLKRATIQGIFRVFKSALSYAVDEEILYKDRFKKMDFSAAPAGDKDNFYTEEELKHFLSCVKENDPTTRYTSILTLAMTGIRKGEMMGLTWKDLDFKTKSITINKARTRTGLGPPKSENGYRKISMNDELYVQLKTYKAWCIKKKWNNSMQHNDEDFVFISRQGCSPIGLTYVEDAIDMICNKYGLRRISPHGLRHTVASILLARGETLVTVAKILGDDPNTILKVYVHSFEKDEIKSIDTMNQFASG
ncbi:tyrosine-type recombinase/integrase [Lysinibacillus sp. NPDC097162]|uniref:tyrosine-type recombinase/integrase n=1 Tax=Lysinibacillus sp. NPDC097162 TaxID=3364140 RepID=UPI0037F525BD